MDFSKMTGFEFEDYIATLLREQGFHVVQTSYSGDGGSDLIITYEKPLFSGKYIVQCKNYSGLVGQPELRDLYGVVMSENANKGILITPSDYTEQAYSFAKGKQLELINGTILRTLTGGADIPTPKAEKKFFDYDDFNRGRYDYLKKKVEENPSDETVYKEIHSFLRSYIIKNKADICNGGLFDELLSIIQMWKTRCYKGKSKELERKACDLRSAEIFLITGEIAKATEILFCNNQRFYLFKEYEEFWPYYLFCNYDFSTFPSSYFVAKKSKKVVRNAFPFNLHSLFNSIGYHIGCRFIQKNLKQISSPEEYILESRIFSNDFECPILHGLCENSILSEIQEETKGCFYWYKKFKQGELNGNFIFSSISCSGSGKDKIILTKIDDFETDISSIAFFKENYFKKSDEELCRELDEVFSNHGFI